MPTRRPLRTLPLGLVVLDATGQLRAATRDGAWWMSVPEVQAAVADWIGARTHEPRARRLKTMDVQVTLLWLGPDTEPSYAVEFTAAPADTSPARQALSARQWEVCEYAAAGATVPEIARTTGLSPETVRTHLRTAYRRLGVANRVELANALQG